MVTCISIPSVFMVHTRIRTVHIASHFKVLRAD